MYKAPPLKASTLTCGARVEKEQAEEPIHSDNTALEYKQEPTSSASGMTRPKQEPGKEAS